MDDAKRTSVIDRAQAIADRTREEYEEWRRQPDFSRYTPQQLIALAKSNRRISGAELEALDEAWLNTFGENYVEVEPTSQQQSTSSTQQTAQLPTDDTLLSAKEVVRLSGVSLSTIKRMVRDGRLPKPARISERRVGWFARDIRAWQDKLDRER